MTNKSDHPEPTPILHRPIPNRVMEWIFVVVVIAVLIVVFFPAFVRPPGPSMVVQDLSNLRQIVVNMHVYALDHDDNFPLNMLVIQDYLGLEHNEVFHSPFDHEEQLVFDETPEAGWYQFGSYWFLAEPGLTIDADDGGTIMLAYRTPRPDSERYLVGFMDGHAEALTIEEFEARKQQHDEALKALLVDPDS